MFGEFNVVVQARADVVQAARESVNARCKGCPHPETEETPDHEADCPIPSKRIALVSAVRHLEEVEES